VVRKVNRGGLIRSVNIPSLQGTGAQFQVQTQMFTQLERDLDGMFNFATKELDEDMQEEGLKFAVDNPISTADYLNANPEERANMLDGDDFTTYGKKVKAVQANILATDLAVKAEGQLNGLKAEALINDKPLELVELQFNALVNGYVDALADVDPETAVVLKSKLATTSAAKYSTILDARVKDHKRIQKSRYIKYSQDKINNIGDMFEGTYFSQIIDENGDVQNISVDEKYETMKNTLVSEVEKYFTAEEMKTFVNNLDAAYKKAKKNKIFQEMIESDRNLDSPETVNKKVNRILREDFGTNTSAKLMYDTLSFEEKQDLKKQAREYRQTFIKDAEDKEKADDAILADTVDNLETDYATAAVENDRVAAQKTIDAMFKIDPTRAKEMEDRFAKDQDNEVFLRDDVKEFLDKSLFNGTLRVDLVRKLERDKVIGSKTANELIKGIATARKAKISTINNIAKRRFGIAEDGRSVRSDESTRTYEKIMEQIYTFADDNPELGPADIKQEYDRIAIDVTAEQEQEAELKDNKNLLTKDQGLLKNKQSWAKYFRQFGGVGLTRLAEAQGISDISKLLDTEEGTREVLRELQEIRDLVESGNLENQIVEEGLLFDTTLIEFIPGGNVDVNQYIDAIGFLEKRLEILGR
jgi:hypothetical protein